MVEGLEEYIITPRETAILKAMEEEIYSIKKR